MSQKLFYAGFFDDVLYLSLVKNKKIIAKELITGDFISDGTLTDTIAAGDAIHSFLRTNKIKPRGVYVFFKTSKAMTRLASVPYMSKRDLNAYILYNLNDLFHAATDGFVTGAVTAYKSADSIVLYAAAAPEFILASYINVFKAQKIKTQSVFMFQELVMRSVPPDNKSISVIANGNKSSIILSGGKQQPYVMRELVYQEGAFVNDLWNIAQAHTYADASEFYFFGGRYKPFAAHFKEKGSVHNDEQEILQMIVSGGGDDCLNLLPDWYKNKQKLHKAIKNSVSAAVLILLIPIILFCYLEYMKVKLNERIQYLTHELQNEAFILSDMAAAEYAEALLMLLDNDPLYNDDATFDIFYTVFNSIPADTRLDEISYESQTGLITLTGESKTDTALLTLISDINSYSCFYDTQFKDISYNDLAYSFCITFSYVKA